MERRLFPDGGYYLDNGASLCADCHVKAEQTLISPRELWDRLGVSPVLPEHLDAAQEYTKWGDLILPDGRRLRGELFQDEAVQKVLREADVLHLYTHYVKYPRTYHLPWSPGIGKDDRVLTDLAWFRGEEVVVTEKMDGESATLYSDYMHARSLDSRHHPSRNWLKNFHVAIAHDIPEYWRVCGENLYAKHSIHYKNLPDYFLGFSVWNEKNVCLSWDETLEWFDLLGIQPVPELYRGPWDEELIRNYGPLPDHYEGYVVRITKEFPYRLFNRSVAKYVRKDHVQTNDHWMHGEVVPNQLRP